jgi:hypothetical protein
MISHLHLRACDHTTWFGSVLGRPLDTSFGLSQFHGHGSMLMCEVALKHDIQCQLLNLMTFSQFLIQSKYIHWTIHKFFICPNITYRTLSIFMKYHQYFSPTLDIILYQSFYPSYCNSKMCIILLYWIKNTIYFLLTWLNKMSTVTSPCLGYKGRNVIKDGDTTKVRV